ncbi:MAG: GHKL domain-containing protein, partial [Gemmatimonadetes bacterium]|nr:GHKL domain-containing protein [Gemmatimonadota bacterium]
SSIAHEVNQPLTAIATYAQACRRLVEAGQAEESEVLDVLDRIGNEALRAGEIIHHLRDLVKKRVGKRVECSINELVEDVEILASVDARLHGVELDLALTPDLPPIIADGVQIQQVVLNLIRNGIDAVEDTDSTDREVLVSTGVTDTGGVLVKVSDSGSGLLEEHESEIFQPFFTTKEDGMGMGLSISRTIVSSHGGRMWFSRNPEGGTTFSFTIPAATEVNGGS